MKTINRLKDGGEIEIDSTDTGVEVHFRGAERWCLAEVSLRVEDLILLRNLFGFHNRMWPSP